MVRQVVVLHGHLGHDRVRQVAVQNRDRGLGWRNHVEVRNLRGALLVVRQGGVVVALFVHFDHDQVHRVAVQSLGHDRFCHCHVVVRNRLFVLLAVHQGGEVADHLVGHVRDQDQHVVVQLQGQHPAVQGDLHDDRVHVQCDVLRHVDPNRVVPHRRDVERTGLRSAGLDSG